MAANNAKNANDVVYAQMHIDPFFTDRYSLCGQGIIMGQSTVVGKSQKY